MVQLKFYTAYSVISSNESRNSTESEKIFLLIDRFSKIKSIEQAKTLIRQTYQIKDTVHKFPLGANGYLDIQENSKKYSVKITYADNNEKECIIYSYKK